MKKKTATIVLFPFALIATILAIIFMCNTELIWPIVELSVIVAFILWVVFFHLVLSLIDSEFNHGYELGYESGCALGSEESYNNGFDAGSRDGYTKAKDEFLIISDAKYTQGYDAGYKEGYSEGKECGYNAGFYKGSSSAVEALQSNISSKNEN